MTDDTWAIPTEAHVTPVPLIGLIGLQTDSDGDSDHRRLWELFSSNRGLDRHALNFLVLDLENLELPVAKPPRTSYEWYLPRGIVKQNWMFKHLNLIPSVIVLFFSNPSSTSVSSVVNKVRQALSGVRQTKLAVVLLQEAADQETITSICTECSIPSRAVFCLPPTSSEIKHVLEIEDTLQELASNYYHGQIKTVKSHRDQLNKATHLQLLIRHSFKIGFLSEFKGDLNSAYKSYTSAYLLLLESRLTEHNSSELRCIAGLLNYKICKLAFKLNLPRDAINQFRKHLEQWRSPPGPTSLSWEHAAWQSHQAQFFAQLFLEACKAGQTAIQTQHPGVYFYLAAEYCISRRKLADTQCSSVITYPENDPLSGAATMEFYGQRPWRVGKPEPSDLTKEKEGLDAMCYREKKTKHSKLILELLSLAIVQYEIFKCPRIVTKLTLQTAEEMMVTADYKDALQVLLPCLPTYRQEYWSTLAYSVLAIALKCSFLSCDMSSYCALCLELCGLPVSGVSWLQEEQKRVWGNLLQILETSKAPLPEPSLTAKSERASVGTATKVWTQLLGQSNIEEIDITNFDSCVDVIAQMPQSVKSDEEVSVILKLRYRGYGQISVKNIQCSFSNSCYNQHCLDETERILSEPNNQEIEFKFYAESADVGNSIKIENVSFLLGSSDKLRIKVVKSPPLKRNRDEYYQDPNKNWKYECKIEPQPTKLNINISHNPPVLVGEWFQFSVELENLQEQDATDLDVSCCLVDRTDPLLTETTTLSLTPETPSDQNQSDEINDHCFVAKKVQKLEKSSKECVNFYIHASTGGERVIVMQLTCILGNRKCLDLQTVSLNVIQPFEFTTNYLTEALEETTNCNTDEEFFVSCSIKNNSDHSLTVLGAMMDGSHPVTVSSQPSATSSLDLLPQSSVEQVFGGYVPSGNMLPQLDSQTITPGKLVLSWSRHGSPVINQTIFDLPSLKLSRALLYVESNLPPFGVLRSQLQATYIFCNRCQDIQEFLVNVEPSDSFMFAGPKQFQIKLFPLDRYRFSLIMYPLVCGVTQLPRVKISNTEGNIAQDAIERLLPSTLLVVPKEKNEKQRKLNMDNFKLQDPVVLENLPFSKRV